MKSNSTIHLVDLEQRDIIRQVPMFDPEKDTVEYFRKSVLDMYAQMAPLTPVKREEQIIPGPPGAPNVRVFIYRPNNTRDKLPAIFYIQGGGFIAGTPDMMDAASLKLAEDNAAVVIAVNYRLAPETLFPGPLEDCYAALDWLFKHSDTLNIDAARIVVMGQSAGGGLAAALALLVRDRAEHKLAAQVLIYPMIDPRTGTADAPMDNPTTGEFMWSRAANQFGWNAMRGSKPIDPERIGHFAPALADQLSNLPPTFISVGSLDLFLEEDVAYGLRLSRSYVPVELHIYNGGVHGFEAVPGKLANQFNTDLHTALKSFLYPASSTSNSQERIDAPKANLEETWRNYLACCNLHQLDELDKFVHNPIYFNGVATLLSDYKSAIASNIEAVPDFHWEIQDIVANEDMISARLKDTGTPTKEWLGIAPSGRSMTTQEFTFYQFRDGKIAEMWFLLDVPSIKAQLE